MRQSFSNKTARYVRSHYGTTSATAVDILISVRHDPIMENQQYKIRRVTSRGTPSYQLGHYEMTGNAGKRRSVFKVSVHLGEHATPEEAVAAWSRDIDHLRSIGRENKAEKLSGKLDRLRG